MNRARDVFALRIQARIVVCLTMLFGALAARAAGEWFGLRVVDDQTGRGVPMVELRTTSALAYYTDSAGYAAIHEPDLNGRVVWFSVASPGYEFPADGFGQRGVKLTIKPGAVAVIKIKRLNPAERLYRVTGEGIYRDSILLGQRPPIAPPPLNAEITGQDGVLNAIHNGRLYWFYGDTLRASYGLGNYSMTGAISDPPDRINPDAGFTLNYFAGPDGFARPMAKLPGEGVVWLSGLVVLPDEAGREKLAAFYQRRQGLGAVLENGFMVFDDKTEEFKKLKACALSPATDAVYPRGYPFLVKETNGVDYLYFTAPYPQLRVKADWPSYFDLSRFESYTCAKAGSGKATALNRDAAGRLVWSWQSNAPFASPAAQAQWIHSGWMRRDESPFRLQDADTGHPIDLNNCSCHWNEYRHRYIMIASERMGVSVLGEVWYAEADRPEGPWSAAVKIATHASESLGPHDFYNPVQHEFFDREGGRVIYFEGSYVNTFSGNPRTTPLYEYNQLMYRLDLSNPALRKVQNR